jgi:hypothetical protein
LLLVVAQTGVSDRGGGRVGGAFSARGRRRRALVAAAGISSTPIAPDISMASTALAVPIDAVVFVDVTIPPAASITPDVSQQHRLELFERQLLTRRPVRANAARRCRRGQRRRGMAWR